MSDLVGKTLGKYEIVESLGRGGMAHVYKAYHAPLDRFVALKVMHGHLAEGKDFQARFQREARAVASLRHENIVQVHDFDVEDGNYYMVMEYIPSVSLKDRLEENDEKNKFMPLDESLAILTQISQALIYAHQHHMLHRDIKPGNILLDQSGCAYLTDFGIAKILDQESLTVTGAFIGTPQYMSPEQCIGDELTEASDVYALGITFYEMVTNQVPFNADTPLAIVHKQISNPLPSPRLYRPDLPESLEKILYKALAKDTSDRFPTVDAFLLAISQGQEQLSDTLAIIGAIQASSETLIEDGLPPSLQPPRLAPTPDEASMETGQKPVKRSKFLIPVAAVIIILFLLCGGIVGYQMINNYQISFIQSTQPPIVITATFSPTYTPRLLSTSAQTSSPIPANQDTSTNELIESIDQSEETLPTLTPTKMATRTPNPSNPVVLADQTYFCRQGPSSGEEAHWMFEKGDKAPIIGKSKNDWWLISVNDSNTRTKCCWVGGGVTSGNLSVVPEIDYDIDRLNCPKP